MSYLICKKCGKVYPLPEGKESFNYQNCECGGKLEYSPLPERDYVNTQENIPNIKDFPAAPKYYPQTQWDPKNKEFTKSSPPKSRIKWKGILVGISFLFASMLLSMALIFGRNIPTNPTDLPIEFLSYLAMLFTALTIVAGFISAYLSGSKNFLVGALNGGMVGVILGFILGILSGTIFLANIVLLLGSISMAGGVMGIFPRKLLK